MEMPSVLRPGNWSTVTGVTLDPTGFAVAPAMLKKKSFSKTFVFKTIQDDSYPDSVRHGI